jgi:hypothetical protein
LGVSEGKQALDFSGPARARKPDKFTAGKRPAKKDAASLANFVARRKSIPLKEEVHWELK